MALSTAIKECLVALQIFRQFLLQLIEWICGIRAIETYGPLWSSSTPRPCLSLWIARGHKQHKFMLRVLGSQHTHRLRLFKACQIIKIAILPIRKLQTISAALKLWTAMEDCNAPTHALHK